MSTFKWLASLTLAATTLPVLQAEPHCPGNVASLRFRSVQRSQIIAPVKINDTGPYDFLVDTGTQITMVDPSLAAELHLKIQSTTAVVVGVGLRTLASIAQLDLLEVGSRVIASALVVVQNLEHLPATDPHIRGILGGNFLGHFDVLIDNAHSMLCLDDAKVMRQEVKGEHIALVAPTQPEDEAQFTVPLIIPVYLSASGTRLLLLLDSGTNVPFLYDPGQYLALELFVRTPRRGSSIDGAQRTFAVLPPQDVRIGTLICHQLSFVTLTGNNDRHASKIQVDGLLTTGLFRRIYISYADRFVVLESW